MMAIDNELVVLVFKTNVVKSREAKKLLTQLLQRFPTHQINFALDDCDKILRVQGNQISAQEIIAILKDSDYQCCLLD